MASNGSPIEKDGHEKIMRTERKRGKRHTFTMEELLILNNTFLEDSYPDFTTRRELSNLVHCSKDVICNWFQNKRAPLPAKERCKIFVAKKQKEFPVRGHTISSIQVTTSEAPDCIPEQSFSHSQETHLLRPGCSSLDTKGVPSQQVGSGPSGIPNNGKGHALEYQGNTGSGLVPGSQFPNYRSAIGFHHLTSSMDYFDRDRPARGEGQYVSPYPLPDVYSVLGARQQEEWKNCPYSLQGQQQNAWQHHLQQLQRPQNCQEKLQFQE
ncbi:cytoplasmic polyadenylated homeobox-like [Orycteropus afer afer]|uniref:Cytoplasmic polyadenylated homeobox-like n=1 Tax=Orycteropus afer afer TaxID=1230840 RepID=A0AC54Z8I6_ORYAF|nr:cytoplasmic polyadenylated homeobox-like [Orycteropus afer afer]